MAKFGVASVNSNIIETTVAKDYSAMLAIHFAQWMGIHWMAMNYAEILNTQKGSWYVEQFLFFEQHIWPGWLGKGEMVDYLDLLKKQQNDLVVR